VRTSFVFQLLIVLTLVLVATASSTADDSDLTELIEKIVQRRAEALESFKNVTFNKLAYKRNMNGDWEIKSEQIWKSTVSAKDPETMHQTVLSVAEDGKPLEHKKIGKEIKKLNKNADEDRERRSFFEPFDTLHFIDYSFTIDSMHGEKPGHIKIDFESKVRDGKHLDGYVVVNETDYSVVQKEFQLADRPTGVKYLRIKIDFSKHENGFYYAARFDFRGHFGVLFFNGRREMIEEYSNYTFGHTFPDSLFETHATYKGE